MNKLIRIEWVSAIRLPTKLMDVTLSMSKNGYFTFHVKNTAIHKSRKYLLAPSKVGGIFDKFSENYAEGGQSHPELSKF